MHPVGPEKSHTDPCRKLVATNVNLGSQSESFSPNYVNTKSYFMNMCISVYEGHSVKNNIKIHWQPEAVIIRNNSWAVLCLPSHP